MALLSKLAVSCYSLTSAAIRWAWRLSHLHKCIQVSQRELRECTKQHILGQQKLFSIPLCKVHTSHFSDYHLQLI